MAGVTSDRGSGPGLHDFVDQCIDHFDYQRLWTRAKSAFNPVFQTPSGALQRLNEASNYRAMELSAPDVGEVLSRVAMAVVDALAGAGRDFRELDTIICRETGHRISGDARRIVVYHGEQSAQRSLLILDPSWPPSKEPYLVSPLAYEALLLGWRGPFPADAGDVVGMLFGSRSGVPPHAIWVSQPAVIVAALPQMQATCVPTPPWEAQAGGQVSTAGALVKAEDGTHAVTVCFHGTGGVGTQVDIVDGAQTLSGIVSKASQVLDTCLVPVSDNWRPAGMRGANGVLDTRAPGQNEVHSFHGMGSGAPKQTQIVAVDFGLPVCIRGRQSCVHTTPDTNYGDSGSALVNQDDRLVGFAFQRTPFAYSGPIQFASWIWAKSALDDLGVTPA